MPCLIRRGDKEKKVKEWGMGGSMRDDLEGKLDRYDRVLLFCSGTDRFETVFARSDALRKDDRKIWIYSGSKIMYPGNVCHGQISAAEEKELLDIYRLYACSDRFQVIVQSPGHGSMFHYVEQGLLSVGEMIEALLY